MHACDLKKEKCNTWELLKDMTNSPGITPEKFCLWDSDYLEFLSFSVSNSIIKTNVFLHSSGWRGLVGNI